jgi:hypothetical protein
LIRGGKALSTTKETKIKKLMNAIETTEVVTYGELPTQFLAALNALIARHPNIKLQKSAEAGQGVVICGEPPFGFTTDVASLAAKYWLSAETRQK